MLKTLINSVLLFSLFFFCNLCFARTPLPGFETAWDFYKHNNYSAALAVYKNVNEKNADQLAGSLTIKGWIITDSISFEEGEAFFLKARLLLPEITDAKIKCRLLFGLGKGYYNAAKYSESINEFLLMENMAIKAGLKPEEKSANFYLSEDFQALNKIPISNAYAKRGIQLSKELKDTASIFRNYLVWVSNYVITGFSSSNSTLLGFKKNDPFANRYGDSILIALKEMKKYTDTSNFYQVACLYDLYSGAYSCKTDFTKQIYYAQLSFRFFGLCGDKANAAATCSKIASAFLEIEKYDSALFYLKKTGELKKELQSGMLVIDERVFNYDLYRSYKGLADDKTALQYLEKYLKQDMELNEGRNIDLQKLREDFEAEKTQQHITDEKEKTKALYKQKQNFYFYISAIVLITLLLSAYFIYARMRSGKEKEKRNLQLLLQNAELTALKAQMNPHFIFNALNSIQHSIVTNNTDEAYRFLSKFSKLIRNILDSSAEQLISLGKEIETLTLYTEIESKRFDNSFACNFETQVNETEFEKVMIPPMIIQPFIENAIWHGLMPKEGTKILDIKFHLPNEKTLIVEISDNGIGREKAGEIAAAKNKKHKSRGLDIINDRVKLLERTHEFSISINTTDLFDAQGNAAGTSTKIIFINTNSQQL